jgi:hypothetical protein
MTEKILKAFHNPLWRIVLTLGFTSIDLRYNMSPVNPAIIGKKKEATARAGSQPAAVDRYKYGYRI